MTDWIEDARRLVDDVLEALLTFMSTTRSEIKVERVDELIHAARFETRARPSTRLAGAKHHRRFVMANTCVLMTQIVARALKKRGVPGVSIGACLFRASKKVTAHSVLRVDGLVVDLLAPALGDGGSSVPFVWHDDIGEREHPERTGTYVVGGWTTIASENQNHALGDRLEDLFEALVFAELFPAFDHQEKVLLENVRRAIDRFVSATKSPR